MQERTVLLIFTWLRIFFCTIEWSIKLAKNWDTENQSYMKSLSVAYHSKLLLCDTRLTRLTIALFSKYITHPELVR